MKAYKCDRCGEFFTDRKQNVEIRDVNKKAHFVDVPYYTSADRYVDLCTSCRSKFADWLHKKGGIFDGNDKG